MGRGELKRAVEPAWCRCKLREVVRQWEVKEQKYLSVEVRKVWISYPGPEQELKERG